jgi:mRNA interferase RelE/StbE
MKKIYSVHLEHRAEKELRRLPHNLFQKVIAQVKNLKDNPRPPGCRKIIGSKNDWRMKVENYRIVYEIDETLAIVRVMRIRLRKEAYRKLFD